MTSSSTGRGVVVSRYFTAGDIDPVEDVQYEKRSTVIKEPDGTVVFRFDDVEAPAGWSQLATDIAVSKYFRKAGVPNTGHETSVKQMVNRVAKTIRNEGQQKNYFLTAIDAQAFEDELKYILINQVGAFNSPVWFNVGLWHQYGIRGSGGNWAWDFNKLHPDRNMPGLQPGPSKMADAYSRPQASACFINGVEDSLDSIYDLLKTESRIFKYGSGAGSNFSKIRGKGEKLAGGGQSSGLISFLEVFDRGAGSIKSGGTTRRAAKMVILNADHPEIEEFIEWKVREEAKARILLGAGIGLDGSGRPDFNGEAYQTVSGQNSNNSIRVTDDFMQRVLNDEDWDLNGRVSGMPVKTVKAKALFRKMCEAAWKCADPGMQYDSTIQKWNTVENTDRINGTNPCSEFVFIDDTACNLFSVNLMKFLGGAGKFDYEGFVQACRVAFIAQEILVDLSSYPTEQICRNSHDYRPLGLGYANLGTLLMCLGHPYDSDQGRAWAAAITSLMTATAYRTSAEMAAAKGPFPGFYKNQPSMARVMHQHEEAASYNIDPVDDTHDNMIAYAIRQWEAAIELAKDHGYRNAQATVLAPTGTIGLLMDCDTTGVEPDFSLVKHKKLAGGGYFKIENRSVRGALVKLGYAPEERDAIIEYIKQHGEVEGAPHLKEGHYPIFDCANPTKPGGRYIAPMGHVRMMAAVQPFLSGAISKTVNLPNSATVEEIEDVYIQSWRLGLKAVAVYRDGCKASQPLSSTEKKATTTIIAEKLDKLETDKTVEVLQDAHQALDVASKRIEELEKMNAQLRDQVKVQANTIDSLEKRSVATSSAVTVSMAPKRERLPKRREGITQEVRIGGQKLYVRTGEYEDGRVGEIFLDMQKQGAAFGAMMNSFAIAVSLGLQYGVPIQEFVDSFTFTRFEPSGITDHASIRSATSVLDFVFRLLAMEYLGQTDFVQNPPRDEDLRVNEHKNTWKFTLQTAVVPEPRVTEATVGTVKITSPVKKMEMSGDAPFCDVCGHLTVRNGACYKCLNCGNSLGCS